MRPTREKFISRLWRYTKSAFIVSTITGIILFIWLYNPPKTRATSLTKTPGTLAVSGSSCASWNITSNSVQVSDNTYNQNSAGVLPTNPSCTLGMTNFGFFPTVPSTASIISIQVNIERSTTLSTATNFRDLTVRLLKAGVEVGNNNADTSTNWTNTDATISYGGNLWGTTWTPSDINNTNFGLDFRCQQVTTTTSGRCRLDLVQIIVVFNEIPVITIAPSDAGSDTSARTNEGSAVVFTATATDPNSTQYYLTICSTNSVTPVDGSTPTCGATQYCVSSATNQGSQATCSYTTTASDPDPAPWFAFACDKESANVLCTAGAQGSGVTGSPFAVNYRPTFTVISDTPDPVASTAQITFSTTASDANGSTVILYVCKASDATSSGCGAGGTWCSSALTASNPTCSYTTASSDVATSPNTYYGFIYDSTNFGASAPLSGTFTVIAPTGHAFMIQGAIKMEGGSFKFQQP